MNTTTESVNLFYTKRYSFLYRLFCTSVFPIIILAINTGISNAQNVAASDLNTPGSASKALNSFQGNGLNFTQNKGQIIDMELNFRPDILFKGSIGNNDIYLRKTGISYISTNISEVLHEAEEKIEMLEKSVAITQQMKRDLLKGETIKLHRTDMDFLDCNPDATVTSMGIVAGYTNYYYSHCTQGITNVGTYNEIDVKDIYPGIDVKYYAGAIQEGGREAGLKYDIVVNPGADPRQIKLKYSGQDKIFINDGKLVIETSLGTMEESLPKVYQVINNRVVDVKAEYKIIHLSEAKGIGEGDASDIITFKLSDYQAGYPLIIDPWWSTYYGGTGSDYGSAVVIDNGGNVLFTGHANSSNFPVSAGAFQFVFGGGVSGKPVSVGSPFPGIYGDAFVVKFDASGNRQWATYYGGTDDEVAYAIAADANGNSAITGFTFSTNMPVAGAFQPANGGKEDAFAAVFNSAGNLKWATYYGGSDVEEGFGITFDPSGNVAITGFTQSLNFPLLGAFQPGFSGAGAFGQLSVCSFFGDMFLVKFNSIGARQWATYYGGSDNDGGRGIATDAAGNIVVTGGTTSTNFPVTSGTAQGIFIVKFNALGGRLWSVSLGSGFGEGTGIAIDKGSNIVIVGPAGASLPVQLGAYKLSGRVFLAKFDANGNLLWVTYDGQAFKDEGTNPNLLAVDVDENSNIYTVHDIEYTGGVLLPDVITTCAFQKKHNNTGGNGGASAASAEEDLFVNKFNGQGKYICSTYIGGKLHDDHELSTKNIAVKGGRMALTGLTFGAFPITPGAFQPVMKSTYAYPYSVHNAFVIDLCTFACGDTTATAPSSIGINAVTNGCQLPKFNVAGNISSCDTSIYSWLFPGATPSVADGLHVSDIKFPGPGTYTVSLIVNACKLDTIKKSVVIPATVGMNATTSYVNASCPGSNTGSATIIETGGTAPYIYSWLPFGGAGSTATNLVAGTYTCIVKDALGCHDTSTVIIYQPEPLVVSMTIENITCSKSNGGVASINPSGGTPGYLYSWNTGGTGSAYANLAAGTYTITVTDANVCTTSRTFSITNTSPADASFTQSPSGTVCTGTTVNFTNTGTTGTYNWNISPTSPQVSGTTANFSYTFLTAGTYSITHRVTTGGCYNSVQSTVTVINCTGPKVTATGSSTCPGICATVTSNGSAGVSPYTFSWSNGATTQNINVCPASTTTYTVTIKDTGGNVSTSTAIVTVNPAVTVTTSPTNTTCSGGTNGSVVVSPVSGTLPYAYLWSNGQTGQTVIGLTQGNYTVTVTDSKGCTSTSTAAITSPLPLIGQFTKGTATCVGCGCKEWIMITASGGTIPYSYTWPDGYVNRYKNQLCPGTYTVNIKDKNGCNLNISLTTP